MSKPPAVPLSLEQKLEILARCGLRLEAPFTVQELLTSWERADFEEPGFDLVLAGLGMTEERPPWRNHCVNAWHFDAECIYDHGDYCRPAERMKAMAQDSLPIENIRDHVDVVGRSAWLALAFHGAETRIDCAVNGDWLDTGLVAHLAGLLARADPSKIFLTTEGLGQDSIIVCVTTAQFEEMKRVGIDFRPLASNTP